MFEYLPDTQTVSSEHRNNPEKKPLIERVAAFRLIIMIIILAVMMFMRAAFPREAEEVSEEFRTSAESESECDRLIHAAADRFLEYINRAPSENGDSNA